MKKHLILASVAGVLAMAGPLAAQELFEIDGARVTLHAHDFLSEEELTLLRLVGQNRDALSVFVPEGGGYAALAVAPADGFISAGMPSASATAVSGLATLDVARADALSACNRARSGGAECAIVLEVAPQ